mgnify:FL=1
MQYSNAKMLAHAAERAKTRPNYLAWVLARYMGIEDLSENDLAKFLLVRVHQLPRLGLCLRPRQEFFSSDIEQVSLKHGVDSRTLAIVVRLVDSISAMTTAKTDSIGSGVLMAARARKNKQKSQGEDGSHDKRSKP